jgi:hypothetical protein
MARFAHWIALGVAHQVLTSKASFLLDTGPGSVDSLRSRAPSPKFSGSMLGPAVHIEVTAKNWKKPKMLSGGVVSRVRALLHWHGIGASESMGFLRWQNCLFRCHIYLSPVTDFKYSARSVVLTCVAASNTHRPAFQ